MGAKTMYAHTANAMNATVAHTLIKNLTTTSIYWERAFTTQYQSSMGDVSPTM